MTTPRFALVVSALLALPFAPGCGDEPPPSDEVVPIASVPPAVLASAKKALPEITWEVGYKMKVDGKDAYEVRGKDRRGRVREVEAWPNGEVIEVE